MSFSARLSTCMERGDLTVSDLQRWFDRPRATVNTWVNGRTPYGPSGRAALDDLKLLEWTIRKRRGLPIPKKLSQRTRADYIRGTRDAAIRDNRVPAVRAAG